MEMNNANFIIESRAALYSRQLLNIHLNTVVSKQASICVLFSPYEPGESSLLPEGSAR